jgi:hypothetical protein
VALREASMAWVGSRVRALRAWVSVLLAG